MERSGMGSSSSGASSSSEGLIELPWWRISGKRTSQMIETMSSRKCTREGSVPPLVVKFHDKFSVERLQIQGVCELHAEVCACYPTSQSILSSSLACNDWRSGQSTSMLRRTDVTAHEISLGEDYKFFSSGFVDYVQAEEVPEMLQALLDEMNLFLASKTSDLGREAESIASFYVKFLAIHPFENGNGRTATVLWLHLTKARLNMFVPFMHEDRSFRGYLNQSSQFSSDGSMKELHDIQGTLMGTYLIDCLHALYSEEEDLTSSSTAVETLIRYRDDPVWKIKLRTETEVDAVTFAFDEREMGNDYFNREMYVEAVECYSRSIGVHPTPAAYANRALAFLKLARFEEAEADCSEAVERDDRYVKAYARRASARSWQHKYLEAIADVRFALCIEPRNCELKRQYDQLLEKVKPVTAGEEVFCDIERDKDGSKDVKVGQIIEELGRFKDFKPAEAPSAAATKPAPKKDPQKQKEAPPPPNKEGPSPSKRAPKTPKPAPPPPPDRVITSPEFAQDNQISLSGLSGTGRGGRIIGADVEGLKVQSRHAEAADLPNSEIRRLQSIPQYYLTVDVRVDKLLDLRTQLNAKLEKEKLSVNDFVLKAAASALNKVPECNSSWTDEYIRQYHNVNISVAVQTERGLMVPVIKDADKKGLGTISDNVRTLAEKARENSLKPADYEGGTFTVSNLGPFGIKQFCAMINSPQACVLAVGTTDKRVIPGERDGEFEVGTFMSATLSCDHRVVDGAIGAHWLGAFKDYIEDPMTLLL